MNRITTITSRIGAVLTLVTILLVTSFMSSRLVMAQGTSNQPLVEMTNTLEYAPDTVRIRVGQTVRWKNASVIVHTVTADPNEATLAESAHMPDGARAFDSGTLDPEETFQHTFTVPGTYRYFCVPHEGTKMYGTVIVEE